MSAGVYFSANDRVLPWARCFLRSFRKRHPDLPLGLIPFNAETEVLAQLADEFHFQIFEPDPAFERLEAIGDRLEGGHSIGVGRYWYRRYAAFLKDAPFERFVYLDVRQLVLGSLQPYFDALAEGLDFVYYDTALNQVYEPGPVRRDFLLQGKARGFNSGRWASRKGLFTLEDFERYTDQLVAIRDQMNPRNTDQFFINYACDLQGVRYGQVADFDGGLCQQGWAGQRGTPYQDNSGDWRLWDYGGLEHRRKLMLLHWAGYPLESWIPHFGMLTRFGLKMGVGKRLKGIGKGMIRDLKANRWANERFGRRPS